MATSRRFTLGKRTFGVLAQGSGLRGVHFWTAPAGGGAAKSFCVHTPVNLSLRSWRYAIRRLGLVRALRHRGFVPAGY